MTNLWLCCSPIHLLNLIFQSVQMWKVCLCIEKNNMLNYFEINGTKQWSKESLYYAKCIINLKYSGYELEVS